VIFSPFYKGVEEKGKKRWTKERLWHSDYGTVDESSE